MTTFIPNLNANIPKLTDILSDVVKNKINRKNIKDALTVSKINIRKDYLNVDMVSKLLKLTQKNVQSFFNLLVKNKLIVNKRFNVNVSNLNVVNLNIAKDLINNACETRYQINKISINELLDLINKLNKKNNPKKYVVLNKDELIAAFNESGYKLQTLKDNIYMNVNIKKLKKLLKDVVYPYIPGRAFEASFYSYEKLIKDDININDTYRYNKDCLNRIDIDFQDKLSMASNLVYTFLEEQGYLNDSNYSLLAYNDIHGQKGFVADFALISLTTQKRLEFSCKVNSNSVKSLTASTNNLICKREEAVINFSAEDLATLNDIENLINENKDKKWKDSNLPFSKENDVYKPFLNIEVKYILEQKDSESLIKLFKKCIGCEDHFKVLFKEDVKKQYIEIVKFNHNGTLPGSITLIPTKLINAFKDQSKEDTFILEYDNDWTLEFRIHNNSSNISNSLKYTVKIIKSPASLERHKIYL